MTSSLAAAITKAASKQTYHTIRFLVDRPLVDDAYRAYAYFRWVDDVVDEVTSTGWDATDAERLVRMRYLERQRRLLEACLSGQEAGQFGPHEAMLVELARHADQTDPRLVAYLRNMMLVMEFDVGRRGRLVSRRELDDYTRWLAIAVTEAMHYFIGNGAAAPDDETRYQAVSGAHIVHMLRDTCADLQAGYFNVPREVLEASSIGPSDLRCEAYRAWVKERVFVARGCFDAGRSYFAQVESKRHRLAGIAYMARFEWFMGVLERNDFMVQEDYAEQRSLAWGVWMGGHVATSLAGLHRRRRPEARAATIRADRR
ncbi:MAG TPA: squalene/phytoene synthase family protein [Candidatus Limnocylindrales bacterium]|nr:squalene/phytoene synthase family protein [Candidatus Limnocylindrales bacterium]